MKSFLIPVLALLFSSLHAQQTNSTVITNCHVIDVRTGKIIPETSVVIKGNIIDQVGPAKKIVIPKGSVIIDGSGKYLLPGMTDGHIHFFQSGGIYTRPDVIDLTGKVPYQKEREFTFNNTTDYFKRYLRLGVTTVADVGGPSTNFIIRDSIRKTTLSPDVLVTGPLFSMVARKSLDNGDAPIVKTTTIAQTDSLFDAMIKFKPDFIKVWYIVTADLPAKKSFPMIRHIAERTHQAGLKLAVHATQLKTAELAVDAGADILVHSVDDKVIPADLLKKFVDRKVTYIPTLTVYKGYFQVFSGKLSHFNQDLYWANPFVYASLSDPETMKEEELPQILRARRKGFRPPSLDSVMYINLKSAAEAGVNIVTGTDAGNIGTMHASSYYGELEAMKLAGLSNAQILKAATINAVAAFGTKNGAIEKGRKADLLLLGKNPMEDLNNLNTMELLIKDGIPFKADSLLEESPEAIVQRQVNAYNAKNMQAFLDTYADDAEIYSYPDKLLARGKEEMRKMYSFFDKVSLLHCEIVKRIVMGNKIVDQERVKFNSEIFNGVAIYEVNAGKIKKATLISD